MLKNKKHNCNLETRMPRILLLILAFCALPCLPAGRRLAPCAYCFAQDEFVYDAKGKRNPFIPLVTSDGKILNLDSVESDNKGLSLEGIIYDKNGMSFAIVNSTVVTVGDTVADTRVLKIEKNKVIFIKDGQTSEVELKEEEEE